MKRLKEIWKETIKKHLEKWRRLPGVATTYTSIYSSDITIDSSGNNIAAIPFGIQRITFLIPEENKSNE